MMKQVQYEAVRANQNSIIIPRLVLYIFIRGPSQAHSNKITIITYPWEESDIYWIFNRQRPVAGNFMVFSGIT
jgi:hypothetical protein